jgi:hypothetical protein
MKHLVGKQLTEKVPFMGDEVEVRKLTVKEIFAIQKIVEKADKDEKSQMKLLRDVIKIAVVGASEITDKEFEDFPLGELTSLSESVMSVSGLGESEGN